MEYADMVKQINLLIYTHNMVKKYNCSHSRFATKLVKKVNLNYFDNIFLENVDYNAVVIIPFKLALLLALPSGCWVWVKFFSKDFYHRQTCYRWTKIIIDYKLKSDFCYVSLILYHNLKERLKTENISVELKNEKLIYNLYLITRLYTIWNSVDGPKGVFSNYKLLLQPKFASKLSLSFVDVSTKLVSQEVRSILHYFFSVPKYLYKGDLVVVPIPALSQYSTDNNYQNEYLYFIVDSFHGLKDESTESYLVSNDRTTLYLSGTKQAKIPYLNGSISYLEQNIPPCLNLIYKKASFILQSYQQFHSIKYSKNSDHNCENKKDVKSNLSLSDTLYDYHGHLLLIGPSGSGKIRLVKLLAEQFSYTIKWVNCFTMKGDTSAATAGKLSQAFANVHPYTVLVLTRIGCLSEDKEGNNDPRVYIALKEHFRRFSCMGPKPFIIGTNDSKANISDDLWSLFTHPLILKCPTQEERKNTLHWLLCAYLNDDISALNGELSEIFNVVSHRTAGFYYGDLEEYVLRVYRRSSLRLLNESNAQDEMKYVKRSRRLPLYEEFIGVLDEMQEMRSEALGLPRIPKVEWKDVGGLEEAKKELINTIQLPIKHPTIISKSFRRSGILLYGPPGTGKTLLAKSVASECGLNFLSVKGPELINMYIGQSEENVRNAFAKATSASPCVIFFDELDSLAPKRGRTGDSGGVMDRIVSALLAELDGIASSGDVYALAATNRPDLLDPALLRPGRFDKQIYLGLCETKDDQMKILRAVTSKIPLGRTVSLRNVCESLPFTFTGADFAALATDAFYTATRRVLKEMKEGEENSLVEVLEEDLLAAASALKPSVSLSELEMYKKMKERRLPRKTPKEPQ